ncbi:TonB-dependent receptor [Aliifodinibius sp. S!AR15-10]|uniref:SusC/RagA family TonB-linked outer membrane protein n=1 Tax=Aliifodinibius sp. S!AR15-10 TaxID=2950437 RepID=UPI00285C8C74|nr:TonB-dependent receptor [Aliifodinibius sp. S!AR15-10]MDR8391058.1 TonB-dependent receptor [Aliifodinibius sp. S!AR15-10]
MYNKYSTGIGIIVFSIVLGLSSIVKGQVLVRNFSDVKQNSSVKATSENLLQRKISLSVKNQSLKNVLRKIQRKSGIHVFYTRDILQGHSNVSLAAERQSLRELLDQLFEPYRIGYWTTGNYIILQKKERSKILESISGQVIDASSDEPLPGVNVVLKGTTTGTSTDNEGNYELNVSSLQDTLVFSFIGYQTQEVSINGRTEIDVDLQVQAVSGEELVVVGYGTQQRRDLTGSISSVSGEEFEQAPANVTSIDGRLQGLASGVEVKQASSAPGGGVSIRIRGSNSITAGNEPLYVIDGFPVYSSNEDITAGKPVPSGSPQNALSSIDPSNIQSIDVLKGPSATAIYGSRGSNGVVIITTKRGISGQNNIDFESSIGLQQVSKKISLLNGRQYAEIINEGYINDGNDPIFENPESYGEGTDWQDAIFRTGVTQNYNLTASGGNESTRYMVSGSYVNDEGIIIGSDFNRGSFKVNLDQRLSEKIDVAVNMQASRINENVVITGSGTENSTGIVNSALIYAPILDVYNADGSYTLYQDIPGTTPVGNPVAEAKEITNNNIRTRLIGNVSVDYDLQEDLTLQTRFGTDLTNVKENFYIPRTIYRGMQEGNGLASVGTVQLSSWLADVTLTYNKDLGEQQTLTLLGGVSTQGSRNEFMNAEAQGFTTDNTTYNDLDGGSRLVAPSSSSTDWDLISYIGRANYNFDNKYLITATGRVDGSSKFGERNKYGVFPSVSVGWRLSEEGFIKTLGLFSNLKLRTSYGIVGNQEIGSYQSLAALSTDNYIFGNNINVGYTPDRVTNPDLKWETTNEFNVGLDMGFANQKLTATVNYYYKKTEDLLLNVPLPTTSGFSSALQNIGEVENKGVEFSLSYQEGQGEFQWNTSLNLTANRNKVLDLGGRGEFFVGGTSDLVIEQFSIVKTGEPLGSFKGYVRDGIFQNEEEVAAHPAQQSTAQPGDPRYKDLNGDGVLSNADKTMIGDSEPLFSGGMSHTFSYKGWSLNLFLYGTYGNDIFNTSRFNLYTAKTRTNNHKDVLNRWTPNNRETNIPRPTDSRGFRISQFYVEDGSYLRLKNLSLSYNIPNVTDMLGLRRAEVSLSAQNLFTITNYTLYDPDVNIAGQSNVERGVDYAAYPSAKTYSLGVSIGF